VNGGSLARRVGIVVLCVVVFVACLGLAWWQWSRFLEAGGDWQNFGYALLWPLFGVFPAFMFWRMRTLKAQAPQEEQAASQPAPPREPDKLPVRQDAVQDTEDDPELAAYNAYLAQLNARHEQETR
jgi:DNA-binding transcriptional regulator of glucitol operon